MPPSINIDDDVFELLKRHAEPLVDSPNSVLRRLLEIDEEALPGSPTTPGEPLVESKPGSSRELPPTPRQRKSRGRRRAPAGSLLPESEYELPILEVLVRHGGRASSREVVKEVGELIKNKLKPKDLEALDSGDIRWENRVHFTRLRLIDRGLLKRGSPRGVWEISTEGSALVQQS